MIVEIPKGSANKYEYDGTLGVFRLDRSLYSAVHYPGVLWILFPALSPKTAIRWTC